MFGGGLEGFQQLDVWWRVEGFQHLDVWRRTGEWRVSTTRCLVEDWRGFNIWMFGGGLESGGGLISRCLAEDRQLKMKDEYKITVPLNYFLN